MFITIEETLTVLIKSTDVANARWLQTNLDELKVLWKEVETLTTKQTEKLENAVKLADRFEVLVNEMEFWLTRIEGSVSLFENVSTILENLEKQKVQFKVKMKCLVYTLITFERSSIKKCFESSVRKNLLLIFLFIRGENFG